MIRLFVGLELPPDIRERMRILARGIPGARWIKPENMHLTLRFIGEVDEAQAREIDTALQTVKTEALEITLTGVGTFGHGHQTHTLWLGLEENSALRRLQSNIESALVRGGLKPEGRKFSPHVTLARVKSAKADKVQAFVEAHNLLKLGPLTVDHFTLFSSHLGRRGADYTVEATYRLSPCHKTPGELKVPNL